MMSIQHPCKIPFPSGSRTFYRLPALAAAIALGALCLGCSTVPEEEKAEVRVQGDRILIVDNTGKLWDVTHAVSKYGFVAAAFQFGLGPNAIRPILNPRMLSPGQSGYPGSDEMFIVIGTKIGDESRAYPINVLNNHEIVDDKFGDQHVAVGW